MLEEHRCSNDDIIFAMPKVLTIQASDIALLVITYVAFLYQCLTSELHRKSTEMRAV